MKLEQNKIQIKIELKKTVQEQKLLSLFEGKWKG